MKSAIKKLIIRILLTAGMLALCFIGMRTALHRSEQTRNADALPVSAQPDLVIVLDAGHGECS